jgi:hypothetical protein
MVAKKTSKPAKKSTTAKKPAAKKPAAKKAPAKKAGKADKTAAAAEESAPAAKPEKAAQEKAGKGVLSTQVLLAHLFALRPRVATSFKPDDFRQAKQLLEEESYANIQEAARAVAEKALELTGSGLPKRQKRR